MPQLSVSEEWYVLMDMSIYAPNVKITFSEGKKMRRDKGYFDN